MIRSHRRNLVLAALAGLGAAFLPSAPADAAPVVMKITKGVGGPVKQGGTKNGGPGVEQVTSTWSKINGKVYVTSIYMSSDVVENEAPNQCKCTSVEIDPITGPRALKNATEIQLTHNNGDRPCNHPKATTLSDGNVVWTFGSDNNSNTTNTYVGVVDPMTCAVLQDQVRINRNDNNNDGAPDITLMSTIGGVDEYVQVGYLSTGGNDTSRTVGLKIRKQGQGYDVTKNYDETAVTPSNIGRPSMAKLDDTHVIHCASRGNNRPPEDGVECVVVDTMTGKPTFKQLIAASDPQNKIYANQPTIADLGGGNYGLLVTLSNGAGKNADDSHRKGSNTTQLFVLHATATSFDILDQKNSVGTYQTHASMCSGAHGQDGKITLNLMTASNTGAGQPDAMMIGFDGSKMQMGNKWIYGFYGDVGYLANIYGQNPHQQGRDFLRCIGDVPNPGHGVKGGWNSDTETLFVMSHAGREVGDPKNSLWFSAVPGKTDAPKMPEPPQQVDQNGTPVGGTPPMTSSGGPDPSTTSSSSGSPSDQDGSGTFPSSPSSPNGCACSTPGTSSSDAGMGALAALGIAVVFASRRRKES
jgi:MYXO-CTERM domain-containing protein